MSRTEMRVFRESGSGVVEIGPFSVQADWTEEGSKQFHQGASHGLGINWVEGHKVRVKLKLHFGRLSADKFDALRAALAGVERDRNRQFEVTIDGRPHPSRFFREVLADEGNTIPTGLVFSNRPS